MMLCLHKEDSLRLNWGKNKQEVNVLDVYRLNIPWVSQKSVLPGSLEVANCWSIETVWATSFSPGIDTHNRIMLTLIEVSQWELGVICWYDIKNSIKAVTFCTCNISLAIIQLKIVGFFFLVTWSSKTFFLMELQWSWLIWWVVV